MPDSSSLQPGYPKHAGRRHYACRYSLSTIEDYRALTLENELIRVTVLLDKGTDIIEFLYKPRDMDYLWRNRNGLRSPRAYQSMNPDPAATFLDWYEGGWQELFPFGGHTSAHRGLNTGMHGEVAYAPWQHEIVTDTEDEVSVRCFIRTRRYPCTLEKTFTIRKGEPALHIAEAASNESDAPIEVVWGHHPAFGWPFLHESCVVDFPEAVVCVENSLDQTGRLALNPRSRWPLVAGRDGKEVDISHVPPPSAQCHDLAVMQEFREGWYAIRNQDAGVGFAMSWDAKVFPYVWFWQNYRGSPDYPWWGGEYVMALEPVTSRALSFGDAVKNGTARTMGGGERIETALTAWAFEGKTPVRGVTSSGVQF
jgi:galactose mutarotase-like enzyme